MIIGHKYKFLLLLSCVLIVAYAIHSVPAFRVTAGAIMVSQGPGPGGQTDFDFEFGAWKANLSRLEKPLSGSAVWREYRGHFRCA